MSTVLPLWFWRPLMVGDRGPDVVVVQRKLLAGGDGEYTESVAHVVRGWQQVLGLPVTGVIDEACAVLLGEEAGSDLLPEWWPGHDVAEGGDAWHTVVQLLDAEPADAVNTLKRFQGNNGLHPTGVVDQWTARKLGQ